MGNTYNLCSNALLMLGGKSITNFDENNTETNIAKHFYPIIKQMLLAHHNWYFANKSINSHSNNIDKNEYYHNIPQDCLKIISIKNNNGQNCNYRITNNQIITKEKSAVLSYIFDQDEQFFPPFFQHALIKKLAAEFCMPLTDDTVKTNFLFKEANKAIIQACIINNKESNLKLTLSNDTLINNR